MTHRDLCLKYFGTDNIEELEKIFAHKTSQNKILGRKKLFSEADIRKMRKLQVDGLSQDKIALIFNTSRATVNKYLSDDNKYFNGYYTLKIDYMYKQMVCTTIYVDFWNQKIQIVNKTNDILHRAFGVNENPNWNDFEYFLRERTFAKSRGDRKVLLNALGLDNYDPLRIVEITKGKSFDDKQWMRFKYRSVTKNQEAAIQQ